MDGGDPFEGGIPVGDLEPGVPPRPRGWPAHITVTPPAAAAIAKTLAGQGARLTRAERAALRSRRTLIAMQVAAEEVGLTPAFLAGLLLDAMRAETLAGHPHWYPRLTAAHLFLDLLACLGPAATGVGATEPAASPRLSVEEVRAMDPAAITRRFLAGRSSPA